MSNATYLATRLRELFLDGKWIANTNYRDLLMKTSLQEANTNIASLNTIGTLTFHVNYYLSGVLAVLNGETLSIHDKFSFNSPAVLTQKEWDNLINELLLNANEIIQKVSLLNKDELDADFSKPEYGSWRRNLDAIIEHSYYHLGQISMLRKLIKHAE